MADILQIKGSARRNGNSDSILEKTIDTLQEESEERLTLDTVVASQLDISSCRSCHGCWETGKCVINDQMQQVYEKCLNSQNVIVAAPIYFTSIPGHLKVMIDRFQCFWVRTYRLGKTPQPRKKGMFLCVGAMDKEHFFDNSSLIIRVWMSTLNVKCREAKFFPGLDAPDDISQHPNYLDDAAESARKFIRMKQ